MKRTPDEIDATGSQQQHKRNHNGFSDLSRANLESFSRQMDQAQDTESGRLTESGELLSTEVSRHAQNPRRKILDAMNESSGVKVPKRSFEARADPTDAQLSFFENEKIYSGDWTNSTLDLLESWYHACVKSSEAHARAARECRRKHRMITIPAIIAGTAATALSFLSAGETCSDENGQGSSAVLKYTVAALTCTVSIFGGISALYNFNSKTEANISASGNFANLARKAQTQIFLPNNLRAHSELVLSEISSEFSHLTTNSPLL